MFRDARFVESFAIALAAAAPFVAFLRYNNYPLFRTECCAILLFLLAAGATLGFFAARGTRVQKTIVRALAVGLFFDFQFSAGLSNIALLVGLLAVIAVAAWFLHDHFGKILLLTFAVFILSSLLLPVEAMADRDQQLSTRTGDRNLPLVVHLVLDEAIGVDGLPSDIPGAEELRASLKALFARHDFRLYGKAHSEHFYTQNSLSQVTNMAADPTPGLVTSAAQTFETRLAQAAYFKHLEARGYRVTVIQSDYMDFCSVPGARPDRCSLYRPFPLAPLANEAWPSGSKLRVVSGIYLTHSLLYKGIRQLYDMIRAGAAAISIPLPDWDWEFSRVAPTGAMALLPRLEDELSKARAGEFYFIHLMLPHSPYSYTRDCVLNPPGQWRERRNRVRPWASSNTPDMRVQRYKAYFAQYECLAKRLDQLFSRIEASRDPNQTILIVHGDHGSRINIYDPRERHEKELSRRDLIDNYATLLAVKAPSVTPGYDEWRVSIQDFLASFGASAFNRAPSQIDIQAPPTIYLTAAGRKIARAEPMPDFGETRQK